MGHQGCDQDCYCPCHNAKSGPTGAPASRSPVVGSDNYNAEAVIHRLQCQVWQLTETVSRQAAELTEHVRSERALQRQLDVVDGIIGFPDGLGHGRVELLEAKLQRNSYRDQ
jgi:hypothetical protein